MSEPLTPEEKESAALRREILADRARSGLRGALWDALNRQPTADEAVAYGMDDKHGGTFNQNQWRLDLIRDLAAESSEGETP